MDKIRKYLPRTISVLLGMVFLFSVVATTAYTAGSENSKKAETSASAKTSSSKSAGDGLFKDETVYVIADAEGKAEKVIVSDWIKNPQGLNSIDDKSSLNNIENVKGDETYKMNSDNMCVWDAKGNDIYYQGTSDNDLPVDLIVSYELDGKPISPKELAGKSGKVKIRFDYRNKQYETVKIDGKNTRIYVPFVMLTGIMLDNDTFKNVDVSNGKVINDGKRTIVAGFALPCMQENLDIDVRDFEIPSSVEITADVKNFKLTTTLTLAVSDVFSDINFDEADKAVNELDEKLTKLSDATDQLIDGSSQLYDGISTLLSKSGTLVEGVKTLAEGAQELNNGVAALNGGADKLYSGASQIDDGVGTFKNGVVKLDNGAGALKDGARKMKTGMSQLADGLGELSSNSEALNSGAEKVFNTLLQTADTQLAASGVQAEKLTIDNYSKVIDKIIENLDEDTVRAYAESVARETVSATVNSQKSVIKDGVAAAVRTQVLSGVLTQSGTGLDIEQYSAAVEAGQIPAETQAQINAAVEQQMNSEDIAALIEQKTDETISGLIEENMKGEAVTTQIAEAVEKAKAGKAAVKALKTQLDSFNEFYQGILAYTGGVDSASYGAGELNDGTSSLVSGTSDLKKGTKQLRDGVTDLKKGTSQLKSGLFDLRSGSSRLLAGSTALADGTQTLSDGTGALVDGVTQLKDGSLKLSKGLKQYKEEGVDVIKDAFNGKAKVLVERVKAVAKAGADYKSFSGIADGMDGKVNFIYKTGSVG